MTSETKIASNRTNAKNSTGPKTARGKSRASGNAWRHGWAVGKGMDSIVSAEVERMAKAICDDHATPALYEQAVIIAESDILLRKLRAAGVLAIQRHSIARPKLDLANQPSDLAIEGWILAIEALEPGRSQAETECLGHTARDILAAVARTNANAGTNDSAQSDNEPLSPMPMINLDIVAQRASEDQRTAQTRNEVDAFQRALPELVSLDRYERRALSRRNRAIRMFQAIRIVAPFLSRGTKGS
jgi:hypothetical protein